MVGCYAMEFVGTFLLTLTVALSLCEDNGPPAPAAAGLMLSALVRMPCDVMPCMRANDVAKTG